MPRLAPGHMRGQNLSPPAPITVARCSSAFLTPFILPCLRCHHPFHSAVTLNQTLKIRGHGVKSSGLKPDVTLTYAQFESHLLLVFHILVCSPQEFREGHRDT